MGQIESYTAIALVLSALAPVGFKFLRRPGGYLALGLLVESVVYPHQFFGYLLWIGLLFAFASLVERVTPQTTKGSGKKRWTYACAAMLTVIAIFFAGSLHLLDRVSIRAFGVLWTLPDHDMWLLLRSISFLWEFGSGRMKKIGFVDYLVWITFPFTVIGPLIRPSEFFPQYTRSTPPTLTSKVPDRQWWQKLSLAVAQMIVGAGLNWASVAIDHLGGHWPKLLMIFGTTPWSFYWGTSGLFHLMECLSLLWGIELPPSFNWPFGRTNLSEYWARWNMTIVRVCRDYLFYNRWGLKKLNAYFNTMMVFLAVGLWHGMNFYWGTWGILNGAGFCGYLWYRGHKPQLAALVSRIGSERFRDISSRVLTYTFVCLTWYVANKIVLGLRHPPLPDQLR
jgi:D-alanyl-lipoteichoic acid acyltransferase DltB (MBOAT superfamily)